MSTSSCGGSTFRSSMVRVTWKPINSQTPLQLHHPEQSGPSFRSQRMACARTQHHRETSSKNTRSCLETFGSQTSYSRPNFPKCRQQGASQAQCPWLHASGSRHSSSQTSEWQILDANSQTRTAATTTATEAKEARGECACGDVHFRLAREAFAQASVLSAESCPRTVVPVDPSRTLNTCLQP
jgi:hypothetical protein